MDSIPPVSMVYSGTICRSRRCISVGSCCSAIRNNAWSWPFNQFQIAFTAFQHHDFVMARGYHVLAFGDEFLVEFFHRDADPIYSILMSISRFETGQTASNHAPYRQF